MKIVLLAEAVADIKLAVDHYNKELPGLGFEFASNVRKTIERIKSFPQAWSVPR